MRHQSTTLAVAIVIGHSLAAQNVVMPKDHTARFEEPKLELRLTAQEFKDGLPERFTFLFVNVGERPIHMPRPTQCTGGNGTVILHSALKPVDAHRIPSGGGGGCASGTSSQQSTVLERARYWAVLGKGQSLTISYTRRDLFNFQEDNGEYEFWASYVPPKLTANEILILRDKHIEVPTSELASAHLHFRRPQ